MTQDEIIEMARQVARQPDRIYAPDEKEFLYYFAKLVAAKEREACAKVCEDIYNDPKENDGYDCYYTRPYLECAEAIRARGQA
jgi:hypothetical protein